MLYLYIVRIVLSVSVFIMLMPLCVTHMNALNNFQVNSLLSKGNANTGVLVTPKWLDSKCM